MASDVGGTKARVAAHFSLAYFDGVQSFAAVLPRPSLSELSCPELEVRVTELFPKVAALEKSVGEQRDEIARLKGLTDGPAIKPGGMNKATEPAKSKSSAARVR